MIGARKAMEWNTSGIEVNVHGGQWTNVKLVVEEMKHKIDPKPLKNRTFPVIQYVEHNPVFPLILGAEKLLR